jgi:hypothetical protein
VTSLFPSLLSGAITFGQLVLDYMADDLDLRSLLTHRRVTWCAEHFKLGITGRTHPFSSMSEFA